MVTIILAIGFTNLQYCPCNCNPLPLTSFKEDKSKNKISPHFSCTVHNSVPQKLSSRWLDQTLKIKWTKFIHLFFSHFKATKCLKCIWHEKYFLLIWKAFENTEEWRFSFWHIFLRFSIMQIISVMTSYCLQLKMVK